jgi:uncharacterized SAM-binding protein YcdF (DUF218 family)
MTINKQNFIIFSSVDWTTHWQLHHQLATSLVSTGNRVLFVENTGVRAPKVGDFRRIVDRLKSRLKSFHGFSGIKDSLIIYTPLFIPYPYLRVSIFINTLFISKAIKRWKKAANFNSPICISFLPTPSVQEIIKEMDSSLVIYYCADDMSRSLANPDKLEKYENRFFKESDLVFTTSHKIYNRACKFSNYVYNIPAGIDSSMFPPKGELSIPDDIKKIKHPIIGYVGAIGDVFDIDLVVQLANSMPDSNVVIVGPKYINTSSLEKIGNIFLLGGRSHDLMPNYIKSFDIALIPYKVNDATNSVYSCKLNEYLSLGKLIVSTNLKEIEIFNNENNNPVYIGKNTEDFIDKTKRLLSILPEDSEKECANRVNLARKNTWDNRFVKIDLVIREAIKLKSLNINTWKGKLSKKYKKSKYLFISKLSLVFLFYLLIFYSPLFWFLGEQLIVSDSPKNSDAIVVFSGDGEVSYQNLSYQNRALDAIGLYKEGYADKIFLSSGREQTIADVEMIKLYLVSKGVPEFSIFILEKYPNSTYQNVIMIKESLEKNNIKSILFTTSPYHSRRAVLTWEKNAPNIEVVSFNAVNPLYKGVQWNIGLDKIRIIIYEYAAIVHNWVYGRV